MRVAFATLGCRQNQFETDLMADAFRADGYETVPFSAQADVYVVNTCTVTARADADSRRIIRQAVRRNPLAFVVATGCYAQASPQALLGIEGVDLVLGNGEKGEVLRYLRDFAWGSPPRAVVGDIGALRTFQAAAAPTDADRTRPFLKVQDGCNFACTFCIIPKVRGPSRSFPPDAAVTEARRLAAAGHPEVVLTGINLGTYGWDLKPRVWLSDLVRRVLSETELPRLRLSSLHPHEVRGDLIGLMAESGRICRHLHLALQSGDDGILRAMGRSYRARHFRETVRAAVEATPGVAIGADVIVGFPGETEGAFQNTVALLAELPVAYLHVFTYSRRAGTVAAGMPDQVAPDVKARRNAILRALGQEKSLAFRQRAVGQVLPAVILAERDRATGRLTALTDNYIPVLVEAEDRLQGQAVHIRAEEVTAARVMGSLV
ncbi:MAG TPA: tRNA (N(6)-L-threonylcarbamoyladenosine(37)-C(2))-methylthiotransferase MtaB [Candidatus Methylomirabilis sp.]|nr:tRNA (N(6)-L-threonylcarbamoyladenosine(37)-C(2))-methylthiotransferase MtaB [Candidatus Methylomirabilis sp.]